MPNLIRTSATARSLVLLTVSATLLAACGGGSDNAADEGAGGVTTITVQQQTGEQNIQFIQSTIDLFQAKNPTIKVKLEVVAQEAKNGSNLSVLSGSTPPDVGMVPSNSPVYQQLLAQKRLAPLDDLWTNADLKTRYGDAVANSLTAPDGKNYLVSVNRVYYSILYYNKDLFAKAGIQEPADHRIASTADLYTMVDALKKVDAQGLAVGGKSGYMASWMVDALLPTAATEDQLQNYLTSWQKGVDQSVNYTDTPFVSVLDTLSEYNERKVFQSGFLAADAPAAEAQFLQGRTGMLLDGSWSVGATLRKDAKFDIGWMLLPPVNEGQQTQLSAYAGDTMVIPSNAKHIEEAKKFLEFLVSDDNQLASVVKASGSLPSVNSVPDSALTDLDPLVREMLADVAANGAQSGWTSTLPGTVGQSFIDPLLQSLYAGDGSPQEIAQKQQEQVEKERA